MKKLYTHENRIIVFNLKNVLQAEGIEAVVVNEFAAGGAGDAGFHAWAGQGDAEGIAAASAFQLRRFCRPYIPLARFGRWIHGASRGRDGGFGFVT